MPKQYAFFYLMRNNPEKIGNVIPEHVTYWKNVDVQKYSGGPFSDRSGGLILFEAPNIDEASSLTENDPFMIQDVIETFWLKEWMRE